MKCDKCGKKVYCIHITRNYERLCSDCYDKIRIKTKPEMNPDDISRRAIVY